MIQIFIFKLKAECLRQFLRWTTSAYKIFPYENLTNQGILTASKMYLTTAHVFFHDSSENLTNLGMLIAERFENVSDNE